MPDNLIQNGGFEDNDCKNSVCIISSIPKWDLVKGKKLELDSNNIFPAHSGKYSLDLDSTEPTALSQDFQVKKDGKKYTVTYFTSLNTKCRSKSKGYARITGKKIDEKKDDFESSTAEWIQRSFEISLDKGKFTFEIGSKDGSKNTCGVLIDDISIVERDDDPKPPASGGDDNDASKVKVTPNPVPSTQPESDLTAFRTSSVVPNLGLPSSTDQTTSDSRTRAEPLRSSLRSQLDSNNTAASDSISRDANSAQDPEAPTPDNPISGNTLSSANAPSSQTNNQQANNYISTEVIVISTVTVSLAVLLIIMGVFYWRRRRTWKLNISSSEGSSFKVLNLNRMEDGKLTREFDSNGDYPEVEFLNEISTESVSLYTANLDDTPELESNLRFTAATTFSQYTDASSGIFSKVTDVEGQRLNSARAGLVKDQYMTKLPESPEPEANLRFTSATMASASTDASGGTFRFSNMVETCCRFSSGSDTQ